MNTKMKIEKFNAVPDSRLYGRLGQVGYSLKDAISELVDNSIDARIPGKKLILEVELDEFTGEIFIRDNGKGMEKKIAQEAIILGKSSKKGKLGFFGLGLKTAGLSLGNIVTIKTKPKNSKEEYLIEFDRRDFEKRNNWEIPIKSYPTESRNSGTEIIISDLITKVSFRKADRLKEYFADRYRSFINSNEIEIFINNEVCIPVMPKFIMEEPVSIRTARGDLITGVLRIQTKRSQKKQEYGFDLYKNKRIITSFSKIGLGMHGEKALICGEFDFDFCPVNFTKNDFLRESENYKAAENAIKQYLRPLIPLFTTKNLNKEKVEKMLKIKEKSGKTPNLREYKELIKSLDNDEEVLISETVYINDAIGKSEVMNEEPARISKHTELLSQIGSHLNHIEETSKLIEECRKDKESINEINNNSMTEMKLSSYSDSLIDLANKIQLLLGKANLQQLASDSGINTANISI